jgi:hypothetical protein
MTLVAVPMSCFKPMVNRTDKTCLKGIELYSWKSSDQEWWFSLLPGTNRLKQENEIKNPEVALTGIEELKKRLAHLAPGENVFWQNLAAEPFPPESFTEVKAFCDSIKINLFTAIK